MSYVRSTPRKTRKCYFLSEQHAKMAFDSLSNTHPDVQFSLNGAQIIVTLTGSNVYDMNIGNEMRMFGGVFA